MSDQNTQSSTPATVEHVASVANSVGALSTQHSDTVQKVNVLATNQDTLLSKIEALAAKVESFMSNHEKAVTDIVEGYLGSAPAAVTTVATDIAGRMDTVETVLAGVSNEMKHILDARANPQAVPVAGTMNVAT